MLNRRLYVEPSNNCSIDTEHLDWVHSDSDTLKTLSWWWAFFLIIVAILIIAVFVVFYFLKKIDPNLAMRIMWTLFVIGVILGITLGVTYWVYK